MPLAYMQTPYHHEILPCNGADARFSRPTSGGKPLG